ncbi:integrase family protein [Halosimplex carlsbadense 2-9-1]|uniref:Integrase family protein n=1 Tax=Halosimplex carlsbadense 2-9-1 TaxID=797114 RepID=M0CEA2_9EURY|nr:site-specific integrase [Halosimplex carlsbadense]ELZ21570.1 integrase family protein [Halosimplex carlsbadense 2-9-1]
MTDGNPIWHETVRPIIEECESPLTSAYIAVLWETGARPSEVATLSVDDITETGYCFEAEMSGKGPVYSVEIVASAPFLRNWLRYRPQHDTGNVALWTKRDRNDGLSVPALNERVQAAAERAGVEVSLYDFRRPQDDE